MNRCFGWFRIDARPPWWTTYWNCVRLHGPLQSVAMDSIWFLTSSNAEWP